MIVAVVVVSPRTVVTLPDDHATITPGMPALAGVVTDQSHLLKQRRAVSDLNLVGGVSARGYEGTGAGEQGQCQFSHVHLLLWTPESKRLSQSAVPAKIGSLPRHGQNITEQTQVFPVGNDRTELQASDSNLLPLRGFQCSTCLARQLQSLMHDDAGSSRD
jgi:hypothetical protein